jgi:fibronectin type 3 domain-containing protein
MRRRVYKGGVRAILFFMTCVSLYSEPWFAEKPLVFYHQPGKGNAIFWKFTKTWNQGFNQAKLYKKNGSNWVLLTDNLEPIYYAGTFETNKTAIEKVLNDSKPLTFDKFRNLLAARQKTGHLDALLLSTPELGKISSCEFQDAGGKKNDEYKLEFSDGLKKAEFVVDGSEKISSDDFEPIKLQNATLRDNQVRLEFEIPKKRNYIRSIHVYRAEEGGQYVRVQAYQPLFSRQNKAFLFDTVKPAPYYSYYLSYSTLWNEEVGQSKPFLAQQTLERIKGNIKISAIKVNKANEIEITWPRVSGAEKILVFRNTTDQDNMSLYADIAGDSVAFIDKKPDLTTFNQYQLKAVDKAGIIHKQSDVKKMLVVGTPAITPITSIKASADQNGIDLKWDYDSDEDIREFQVFLLAGEKYNSNIHKLSAFAYLEKVPGNKNKLNLKLKHSGWYNFYAIPVTTGFTQGPPGSVVSVYQEAHETPAAPTSVTALYDQRANAVSVIWSRNNDKSTGKYLIYREVADSKEAFSSGSKFAETHVQFQFKDIKITRGKWYRYGVSAQNFGGSIFSSAPKSPVTYCQPIYIPDPPGKIIDLKVNPAAEGTRIHWRDENDRRKTTYRIFLRGDNERKYALVAENLQDQELDLQKFIKAKQKKLYVFVVPVASDKSTGEESRTLTINLQGTR